MKTNTNIHEIYNYLKNHQYLKEFDFKINEYKNLEITDKRTLDPIINTLIETIHYPSALKKNII